MIMMGVDDRHPVHESLRGVGESLAPAHDLKAASTTTDAVPTRANLLPQLMIVQPGVAQVLFQCGYSMNHGNPLIQTTTATAPKHQLEARPCALPYFAANPG